MRGRSGLRWRRPEAARARPVAAPELAPGVARRTARPVPGRRLPAALLSARIAARTAPPAALRVIDRPRARSLDQIRDSKRSLLVTYRRDGTPVPTPAWAAEKDGRLYVRSERSSGKVKRLARDRRMLIAPCTIRGKPLGAPLDAVARVLSREQEPSAEQVLASRYGFGRSLFELAMDLLRVDMCYLEIIPAAREDGPRSPARR